MRELRIVSLVPSATEAVHALGLGHALVGRSHVCNFPPEVEVHPVLTRPELTTQSSRGIHDEVRARLGEGLALYEVDLDRLRSLAPTHLLVQDQCAVCAVAPSDLEGALAEWLGDEPVLVRLAPHQLADVWHDLGAIGGALGYPARAAELQKSLSHRMSDLAEAAGIARAGVPRPRVVCVEWLDPIMIAGHWVPELIRLAGGQPILSTTGGPSVTVDLAELEAARPDIILIEPCGFGLEATRKEWAAQPKLAEALRGWRDIDGRPVRVALADGDAYFNRPGPRLVESAEVLAEVIRRDRCDRPHEGTGWQPISGFEAP